MFSIQCTCSIVSKCHCVLVTFAYQYCVLRLNHWCFSLFMFSMITICDSFIVALICVIYHFSVLLLWQLLILHHDWYFIFISYHVQLRLLFLFNIRSASFLFSLFSRHHTRTHTHARKHTHAHCDILSDIMIILDHGNICVDTIFMMLSCIVFQILKK